MISVKTKVTDRDLGLKALIRELDRGENAYAEAGLFEGEKHKGSDLTMAQLGAVHEFGGGIQHGRSGAKTITVPERSFLRRTHDEHGRRYAEILDKAYSRILAGKARVLPALTALGERVASDIRKTITAVREPPNAPSTIARKGSSNPLIDTGAMRNWVRSRVALGRPSK